MKSLHDAKTLAAKRIAARLGANPAAYNTYEATRITTHRTFIPYYLNDSKDANNSYQRTQVMALARHLYRNDGLVRGIVADTARYTIGGGFIPVYYGGNDAWWEKAKEWWRYFCLNADFYGVHDLDTLAFMASESMDVDGDIGAILTEDESGFPKVQMIEGHRINCTGADSVSVIDGIKLDSKGRAMGVYLDTKDGNEFVQMKDFIMLFDPERSDMFRGISSLCFAINHLRDKHDILEFEKKGIKINSIPSMVLYKENGEDEGWGNGQEPPESDGAGGGLPGDAQAESNLTVAQLQSGMIPVLKPGERLQSHDSSRPSPAFTGFLDYIIRDVATGLGLPFEFVWNSNALNGTAARFIIAKAQRRFEERQSVFRTKFYTRIFGYAISKAIKTGRLDGDPEWFKVSWQTPRKLTVDFGNEADANRNDIFSNLRTYETHYGEQGLYWLDQLKQRKKENDWLTANGMSILPPPMGGGGAPKPEEETTPGNGTTPIKTKPIKITTSNS